jgi:hypothetical protein
MYDTIAKKKTLREAQPTPVSKMKELRTISRIPTPNPHLKVFFLWLMTFDISSVG